MKVRTVKEVLDSLPSKLDKDVASGLSQEIGFVSHLLPEFLSSRLSPLRLGASAVFPSDICVYRRSSAVDSALRTPNLL